MEVQAILKNFRMSAQKVREVVRQVQGLRAGDALAVLKVVPRKSARAVAKTLASAIANAENNHGYTPLIDASNYGHVEVVHALLAAGADKRQVANNGATAALVAGR